MTSESEILVKHLSKKYGDRQLLKDISLSVEKGKVFGLLGPSGAGKTSIIRILTKQDKNFEGTVLYNNKNSNWGYVLDNPGICERLTCYQNLKIFSILYNVEKKKIYEALNKVGLSGYEKTKASRLSKGMKQRLVIARAILSNPQIMFLDEPTSGLDPMTAELIYRLISDLKNCGKTIFLTTHNMYEAEKLCDCIALLNRGEFIQYGSVQEIKSTYNKNKNIIVKFADGSSEKISLNRSDIINTLKVMTKDIVSIHSDEPTLNTIFLELTGEELHE